MLERVPTARVPLAGDAMIYNCEGCEATFDHDDSVEDCGTSGVENLCSQLIGAGWKPARVEVRYQSPDPRKPAAGDVLCIRAGWICPRCRHARLRNRRR